MVDTTGDGVPDAVGFDTSGDGVVDSLDTNGDGRIDTAVVIMQPPEQDFYDRSSSGGGPPPQQVPGGYSPKQDHRDHTLTPRRDHGVPSYDGRGALSPSRDYDDHRDHRHHRDQRDQRDHTLTPRSRDRGFSHHGGVTPAHSHRDRTLTPSRRQLDDRGDGRRMPTPNDDDDRQMLNQLGVAPQTQHSSAGGHRGITPPPNRNDCDFGADRHRGQGMLPPDNDAGFGVNSPSQCQQSQQGQPVSQGQHRCDGPSSGGVPQQDRDQSDCGPMVWRLDNAGSAADDALMRRICGDKGNVGADANHDVAPCVGHAGRLPSGGVSAKRPASEIANEIWEAIDPRGAGSISKLELCMAVQRDSAVSSFLLPGVDSSHIMDDETSFNAVDALFEAIGNRQHRIHKAEFVSYFTGSKTNASDPHGLLPLFKKLDADGSGSVSKFEFVNAVQRDPSVAALVLPGVDNSCITSNVHLFDTINDVFDEIARGKKCFDFCDFRTFFKVASQPLPHHDENRNTKRILIIGPGFGLELNPRQGDLVMRAGFQVRWVVNVPNPEQPGFPMMQYLPLIKSAIDEFQPHLVACASKGGHYMIALWQTGLWKGPSLMINAHPSLRELPRDVPIVLAVGSNDEFYVRSREDLEHLISTGTRNQCFLYYAGSSGPIQGGFARIGDKHNMDSLLAYDCLPRLMDAVLYHKGPESHMIWSWRQRLAPERLEAEQWLSYCPDQLRRRWVSAHHEGRDDQKVFEVPRNSNEFQMVATVFRAAPREPAAYGGPNPAWDRANILRVQRVENGLQEDGSAKPYYAALRKSIEDQGITFEPGVHTRWAFHGTDAIESIINNPLSGFQPLASGARLGSVWGSGSYFARDAKYVLDGNFCQAAPDGTRQMLMCLVMTGIPCLGAVDQKGVLPFREKPHRYNSTVDSLSSPEIFIVQHPSAAYPAYLITFA